MSTLTIPLGTTAPYVLLALGLLQGAEIKYDFDATELSEPTYGDVKGTQQVRAALEQGLPGKEVSLRHRATV